MQLVPSDPPNLHACAMSLLAGVLIIEGHLSMIKAALVPYTGGGDPSLAPAPSLDASDLDDVALAVERLSAALAG